MFPGNTFKPVFNPIDVMLHKLMTFPIDFYITGKKFFWPDESLFKYVFFTQYEPETVNFLENMGFFEEKNFKEWKESLVFRWKHRLADLSKDFDIEVRLIRDYRLAIRAQEIMKKYSFHKMLLSLREVEPYNGNVWEVAFRLAEYELEAENFASTKVPLQK